MLDLLSGEPDRADPAGDGPQQTGPLPARAARLPRRPGHPLVSGPGRPPLRPQEPAAPGAGRRRPGLRTPDAFSSVAAVSFMPMVEAERDLGSRARQEPRATLPRNVSTARLNTSGSSRLAVWPVRGRTARPAVGMVRLSISAGSRQPSSSSPTSTRTGMATLASSSVRSYRDGRAACTPRMVRALPSEECPASAAANSAHPRGFLFWNWTRACRSHTVRRPSPRPRPRTRQR